MVLGQKYESYSNALLILNLKSLEHRRKQLSLKFAKDAIKYDTMRDIFHENTRQIYDLRTQEKYHIDFANTERKRKFAVIQMQHLLNDDQ